MKDQKPHLEDTSDLRRQAQEKLWKKADQTPQDLASLSPEEIQNTLHELGVHQIELEIQNEEMQRTQLELKTAHERYFSLYDLAPVGYATLSEQGLILEANLTAAGLLGVARGALVKQPVSHFILKEDQDIYYLHRKRLLESGEAQNFDLRMVKKDGTPFWANLKGTAAQDGDGKPMYCIVISDIAERKTAEAEQQQFLEQGERDRRALLSTLEDQQRTEAALRESEIRFRVAQEMSPDGFTILHPLRNEQGEIVDFVWVFENRTIAQINNTDATEIKGKRVLDLFSSQKGTSIFETYIHVANTGNPQIIEEVYVGEVLSKPTYLRLVVVSMGEDIAIHAQDITERKQAENLVRDMNMELEARVKQRTAQLESANLELEAFSYSVSHDLRAPLRAIDGFVSILEEDYTSALDEEARRLVGVIRANTHSMGQLIDDLLRYSRMTRADMLVQEVDMAGLVRSVYFELTKERERQRVDFHIGRLPRVQGDPSMLRQVWMNLISNALKFTSKCEKAVIKVNSRRENGQVIFCVQDNGTGFDMRYADKLFNVFQRLHTSAEFEGTGVGLAIVKSIILRHAGRVWAQGAVDAGAKFYLSLPDTQKGLKNGKEL